LSSAFSLSYVWPTLLHYARWLPRIASWLVLLAPGAAWAWRGERAGWRTIALSWVAAVFGGYAAYPGTSQAWWTVRFVLPALPILIVASIAGLREACRALARRLPQPHAVWHAIGAAVVALAAVALVRTPEFGAFGDMKEGERVYQDALKVLALNV